MPKSKKLNYTPRPGDFSRFLTAMARGELEESRSASAPAKPSNYA